jgi:hypothetical protein
MPTAASDARTACGLIGADVRPYWSPQSAAAEGESPMANTSGKGWSAQLTRTIVLRDGTTLATLADVRTFILNEPVHIQERGSWQHAAELMILAAERGGSVEAATIQIENALFLEARYARP